MGQSASFGPSLATLRVRSGGQREAASLPVRGALATIGADAANDVVLDGPGVAPRHAELRLRGGVWTLTDLGSPAGSWVDGEVVAGEAPLAPGSALRIGDVLLAFDPKDRWQDSPPGPRAAERPVLVRFPEGSRPLWPTVLFVLGGLAIIVAMYLLIRTL